MHTTRRDVLAGGAASLALLAGCGPTGTGASSTATSSAALKSALDQAATNLLKLSPETATGLAVSEAQAGGRYMDKLSDASKAAFTAAKQLRQSTLATLNGMDRASLSHDDQVSLDVVKTSFENDLACLQWEIGAGGASTPYVVNQLTGSYTTVPDFLDSQHQVTNRDQADAYVARLGEFARQLTQEVTRIHEDQAAGIVPPDFAIRKALMQLRDFASKPADQTTLVQALKRKLGDVHEISAADANTLVRQATQIVHDRVLPAYHAQIDALNGLLPHAVHDAGIWRLPHGDEMYAAALQQQTTTTMKPEDIHQMGIDIARDLNSQMDTILKSQGLTRGTLAERVQSLFSRPDQMFPESDAGREQCLAYLNQLASIRDRLPEKFNVLPRAQLQIKRVPESIQEGHPEGYYLQGALDGSRPGTFYVNLRKMQEVPKFTLPTLFYHEGIPGHHLQISIQQESTGLPFIRSAILGFNAYAEGWALYAEQLSDEMGSYANDPFGRVGFLKDAAFRASRLIVDTGMHHMRWSREQALSSMMAITGDIESATETEIERYCVWPGQACGYMIGKMTLLRLRAHAQQTMGARFDIKKFHDCVLTNGSIPLTVTETVVNDWASGSHA